MSEHPAHARIAAKQEDADNQARWDFDEDAWAAWFDTRTDAEQVRAAKRLRDMAFGFDVDARGVVGTGAGGDGDRAKTEATPWVNRSEDCPEDPAQAHHSTSEGGLVS